MNYCVKCLKSEANCKCPNQWHPAVSADQLTEAPMYMEVRCPECDRLRAESAEWNKRALVAEAELAAAREEMARFGAKEIALKQLWNKSSNENDKLRALCAESARCNHRAFGIGGQMCGAGALRVDMSEDLFGRIAAAGRGEGTR